MKINLIGNPQIIMSNPNSKHNYFGWPTVAKLQDGTITPDANVPADANNGEWLANFDHVVVDFE